MARILTLANLTRWVIGSIIAGTTAAIVTFVVADYVIDERAKAVETAITNLSNNVAKLEERVKMADEQPAEEGGAMAEDVAMRVAEDVADRMNEALDARVEDIAKRVSEMMAMTPEGEVQQ